MPRKIHKNRIEIPRDAPAESFPEDGWPPDAADFGRAVSQARQHGELTRASLAQKVGVTEATIRNVESGKPLHRWKIRQLLTTALALDHQKGKPPLNT